MKIAGLGALQGIGSATSVSRSGKTQGLATEHTATTVSVSRDAAWIEALRAEAQQLGPIRADVVAETRAQLQAGTFEDSVDLESVVDSLLADF